MKTLKSIFLASCLFFTSSNYTFSEESKETEFKKLTGIFYVPPVSPLKQDKKKDDEELSYEERKERFSGKGVDFDKFISYLDKEHAANPFAVALVDTHNALKEIGKSIEQKIDPFLDKYGLELKVTGGKEDSLISMSLIYRFD